MASRIPGAPILVVDDDRDTREAVAMFLTLDGYQVAEAENGQVALDAMRARRPAALVLDLTMPVVDGWAVRRTMQSEPELSQIPVIIVSGVADTSGTELQGCAILKKPVDPQRLRDTLRRCITS